MPLSVSVGGIEKPVSRASVIVGGAVKAVRRIEAWNGGAWKVVQNFTPAFSAIAVPSAVVGTRDFPGFVTVTTNSTTATPTGGQAPYSYAWTFISGYPATISNASFATTTFSAAMAPGDSETTVFSCLVTDSIGQTATAIVSATFNNISNV